MTTTHSSLSRIFLTAFLTVALVLVGCSGDNGRNGAEGPQGPPGQPGQPGEPGTSTGVLSGTVTNALTQGAVQGATVSIDPAIEGLNISTDANGEFSASLPIGVYAVTVEAPNYTGVTDSASITAGQTATVNVALQPTAAVVINVALSGDQIPNGQVTAKATVTPMDGSTVTGMSWDQTGGVAVDLPQPADGDTIQVTLPALTAFKDDLINIVANVRHYLLDRNMVMGINPLDLEEASTVMVELTVQTSKGTYSQEVDITAALPFQTQTGIKNVPIGVPLLLHGKNAGTGATYDWKILSPSGSGVTALQDASTQNPYFTPDVPGKYSVTEADIGASLDIYAGKWVGAIGPDGSPSVLCTTCHDGVIAPDEFTPWSKSGHAEIFTQNLNAGGHYGSSCFVCHTVGYNTSVANNGFDDQPNYASFLDTFFPDGHAPQPSPNNWSNMLMQFPAVARLANIQCENCHGPNDSEAHKNYAKDNARYSLSADVCGVCHGEPARHGRFQQWQESLHANYTLAEEEATVENRGSTAAHCGRCHSGQGFIAWIQQGDLTKNIQGANGNATVAELMALGLTLDEVQPQTCTVCHDPHAQGNLSGEPNNATVRIEGDTALLPAGFKATGVGRGALCITCHNTRNGLHNDSAGLPTSYSAPHVAAQGDVLMGQNAYFVQVGQRSPHSFIVDTCTTCHMELTPPPAEFSYEGSGTNHTFEASLAICSDCHGTFDGGTLQTSVEEGLNDLGNMLAGYLMNQITTAGTVTLKDYTPHDYNGNSYDLRSDAVQVSADNVEVVGPTEPHGQQGYIVNFNTPVDVTYSPSGESPHTLSLTQAQVQLGDFTTDGTTALIPTSDPLVRAGWNYFLIHGDNSKGVHNPSFVFQILNASEAALVNAMATP